MRREPALLRPRRQRFFLLLASLLATVAMLEVAVRTSDAVSGKGFFSEWRSARVKRPKPVIPFRTFGFVPYREQNGVRYISSRHGELYPLPKPPGTFRIVCFGGSTTEDLPTFRSDPAKRHYPLMLQELLRSRLGRDSIEVINVGFSAYSTPHFLILLELDVLSWQPDLVILSEDINDLLAAYFPAFALDYSHKYGHPPYLPGGKPWREIEIRLFRHLQAYWLIERRLERATFTLPRRRSYGDVPPAEASAVFQRNLESFVTLAQSKGIGVLLASQPFQPSEEYFLKHMSYKEYNDRIVYPLQDELVKHHHYYNEILRRVAEEKGAWFLDNDASFAGDKKHFIDLVHYTPEGSSKLAANYADFLIANGIVR
jgi:hypothetical protein